MHYKVPLLLLLVLVMANAQAKDERVYLNVYGLAYHAEMRERDWNEDNTGVGLRMKLSADTFVEAGTFKDSMYEWSSYAGAAYQLALLGNWVKAGAGVFLMSRPSHASGDPFIAALPLVSLTAGPVVTNVTYIPRSGYANTVQTWFVYWSLGF